MRKKKDEDKITGKYYAFTKNAVMNRKARNVKRKARGKGSKYV